MYAIYDKDQPSVLTAIDHTNMSRTFCSYLLAPSKQSRLLSRHVTDNAESSDAVQMNNEKVVN
jgi:hypothetical protein